MPKNNETDGLSGGDQVNSSTQGSFARRMGNERITLMIGRNDRFERGGLSSGIGGCGSSTDFVSHYYNLRDYAESETRSTFGVFAYIIESGRIIFYFFSFL